MRPHALLETLDGDQLRLGHGDFIGRFWSAAWRIDDPRISEAHAAISLRAGELRLLGLRGRFRVADQVVAEVRLEPGVEVLLADGLGFVVRELALPAETLGLRVPGMPLLTLDGACSLHGGAQPRVVPGTQPDAAAWVWGDGDQWTLRLAGQAARPLLVGDAFVLDGARVEAVAVAQVPDGPGRTVVAGAFAAPLTIVARFDTVHIHSAGELRVTLDGLPARIVSELVALGGPVRWQVLAEELWGRDEEQARLRNRLDVALARLRRLLRDGRLRSDLVRMTGTGQIELLLHPRDRVQDDV